MYHQQFVNTVSAHSRPLKYEEALDKLEVLYQKAKWSVPERWWELDFIREKICEANQKANPGVPLCAYASTIAGLIKVMGIEVLARMVKERMDLLLSGQYDSDPVRVFVKQEPHTVEKAKISRWRLIWLVSFVDQIIDAIVFDASLQAEIDVHDSIPSRTGWSWYKGGMKRLYDRLYSAEEGMQYGSLDKKFWDWSAGVDIYDMDESSRKRLCLNSDSLECRAEDFFYLMSMRYDILKANPNEDTGARMQFSDGEVYYQTTGGIVKSGSKITISLNGRAQIYLKLCFCEEVLPGGFDESLHRLNSMGDDSLERLCGVNVDQYAEWLRAHGYHPKYADIGPLTKMHFCSHSFRFISPGTIVGESLNKVKHVFCLKWRSPEAEDTLPEMVSSYLIEHVTDSDRTFYLYLRKLMAQLDVTALRSDEYYMRLHTGHETYADKLVRPPKVFSNLPLLLEERVE